MGVACRGCAVYNPGIANAKGVLVPELPEVETVVRDIRPHLVGRVIANVRLSKQSLREMFSPRWKPELVGQRIAGVERHGKWIFVKLANERTLVIHLGMTGQLTVADPSLPVGSHTHVVFGFDEAIELRFRDVRRFGSVSLLDPGGSMEQYLKDKGLGPEPFQLEPAWWKAQLAQTRRNLKAILLDQRVVAGVGNIYADESCFEAKLHPGRLGNTLAASEIRRLAAAVPAVLTRAIAKRGSTIRDYIGGSGLRGGFQDEFCVYGRTGEPCPRCRREIQRIRLAGRSTHFCPRCQKA